MRALEDRLEEYWDHPAKMVREIFGAEPDPWQEEALELFPTAPRIAMKACKGPGKSTVLAWLGWNYLLTRPHPKIAATSISATNLADGLWSEMAKWQAKSELLKAKFTWTKTRIFSNEHPETWFMAFKSWSRSADANEQANTLAGFHADYVLFLLDETGGMPRSIMPTAEAAFAGCIECHIVQAGNPTNLEGPLYDACTRGRHLWKVIEITGDPEDPKRSSRIPVEHARQQIAQYGRDNPWVQVNIFGRFPPAGLNQLIGPDEVAEAMRRHYGEHEIGRAPKIMGVDVARFGDDSSVIFLRRGLQSYEIIRHRNIDSLQGAGVVARKWGDWGADAVFIDSTGGFGAGWIDQLRVLGRSPICVAFSGQAHDSVRYYNKRAEMYFDAIEWIRRGGALPESPELAAALTQTTYSFQGDRFLLEPKEDVKLKLGYSPDEADAFVLTFAEPVAVRTSHRARSYSAMPANYDPFAEMTATWLTKEHEYNPFR